MILKSGMSGSFRAVTRKKTAIKVLKNFMQKVIFRNWFFVQQQLYRLWCVMKAVKELGLKIPEDIAVIGIGDEDTLTFYHRPLRFMRQYPDEIGQQAARFTG